MDKRKWKERREDDVAAEISKLAAQAAAFPVSRLSQRPVRRPGIRSTNQRPRAWYPWNEVCLFFFLLQSCTVFDYFCCLQASSRPVTLLLCVSLEP